MVSATVRTHGTFAVDTFTVTRASDGQPLSDGECQALRASLVQLLGTVDVLPTEDDDDPVLSAADAASRASYALQAEQWEIAADALVVHSDQCLGKGTFGECFHGHWRGTPVAVKRLRPGVVTHAAALELFRREMAVCVHLAHPNVVQFLGACTTREPLCIVTELMTGGSLADKLDAAPRGVPYPLHVSLPWVQDCARGMRYLHERQPIAVIHRDLKPANLLFDASGRLKITDFGLSKSAQAPPQPERGAATPGGGASSPTACRVISRANCGSYLYTAPEVCRGEAYTSRVDVFAFAMILFEIMHGELPFEGMPAAQANHALVAGSRPEVRPRRGTPRELVALLERCWDAVPSARPSFGAITDIVDRVATSLPKVQEVPPPPSPAKPSDAAGGDAAAAHSRSATVPSSVHRLTAPGVWSMILTGARVALAGVRMAAPPTPPSPLMRLIAPGAGSGAPPSPSPPQSQPQPVALRPVATTPRAAQDTPASPRAAGAPVSPSSASGGTGSSTPLGRPPRLPTPIPRGTPTPLGRSPLGQASSSHHGAAASPATPKGTPKEPHARPSLWTPSTPRDAQSPPPRVWHAPWSLIMEAHNVAACVPWRLVDDPDDTVNRLGGE